ncbi:MAG: hypothetical protein KKB29_00175, partial [Nanoarchaeota archaeon]|nr:hypothetical protein [Nanoarchaeota archaeon]
PSSPEIRAIASYGKRVIIETTRVDFDGWRQELSLSQVGAYIPENQKTVKIEGGVSPIIKTRTQNAARGIEQKDVRTLLTILTPYGSEELGIAEDALNVLYNQSCFFPLTETYHSGNSELDSLVGEDSDSGGRGIGTRQEMRQGMERVLTELQRPALLLKMRVTSKKIIRAQVFRMTAEELKSEIEKKVAENPFLKID